MRIRILVPGFALLCLSFGSLSQADPLYTNLGPGTGFNSDVYGETGASSTNNLFAEGFQFTASQSGNVFTIQAALQHVAGANDQLTMQLFSDSGSNTVGSFLETLSSANPVPDSPALVTFDSVTHSELTAGTKYWLLPDVQGTTFDFWYANNSGVKTLDYINSVFGTSYRSSPSNAGAFQVNAVPVPELSTLFSFAGMLGAGGLLLRRRK